MVIHFTSYCQQPGSYIIFVSFTNIEVDGGEWYYEICTLCKGNTRDINVGEKCPSAKCGQTIVGVIPRYFFNQIIEN